MSTVERVDPPTAVGERAMLEGFLDYHRATVHLKCAGLGESDAWRAPLPSSPVMSPAGLVNHLYWVERNWFERILTGADVPLPWLVEPDGEFRGPDGQTLADALARYAAECTRSTGTARRYDLDTLVVHPRTGESFSLRWIYLHMIEETARHNGHLDAMRELIDGTTGE
jgi:uncharacterized damage-inducible protein DinB